MADRSRFPKPGSSRPEVREVPASARPPGRQGRQGRQGRSERGGIPVAAPFRNPLAPVVPAPQPTLLPLIGVNDEILPAFERTLQPIVERAQAGDRDARDALFASFQPKIMRFARRINVPFAPGGARGLWERDDVAQEAYLVFLGVIESWPPAIPFGRYFLANFPWRLRDAVYRGFARRGTPPRTVAVAYDAPGWQDTVADDAAPAAESRALIEALAASFEPPLDDILRLHILDGLTLTDTAARIGISRRTITRHWHTILVRLRPAP
jgi:RNA polymerase sigma factor (sigma-70 family)